MILVILVPFSTVITLLDLCSNEYTTSVQGNLLFEKNMREKNKIFLQSKHSEDKLIKGDLNYD